MFCGFCFILLNTLDFHPMYLFSFTLSTLLGNFHIHMHIFSPKPSSRKLLRFLANYFVRFFCYYMQHSTHVWSLLPPLPPQTAGWSWHWRIPAWTPSVSGGGGWHSMLAITWPLANVGRTRLAEIISPRPPDVHQSQPLGICLVCRQIEFIAAALIHLNHWRVSFKDGRQVLYQCEGFGIGATQRPCAWERTTISNQKKNYILI